MKWVEWHSHCDRALGYDWPSVHMLEGGSSSSGPWLTVGYWKHEKQNHG